MKDDILVMNLTDNNSKLFLELDKLKYEYYKEHKIPYFELFNSHEPIIVKPYQLNYITNQEWDYLGTPAMLEKFIYWLRFILVKKEYESCRYFVRTNASTFINIDYLEKIIPYLPKNKCYAGYILYKNAYISGTCIIISRDVAELLVNTDIKYIKDKECDDRALGIIMKSLGIRMTNIPMIYFCNDIIPSEFVLKTVLENYALIRIKNNYRIENDVKIWRDILKVLDEKKVDFSTVEVSSTLVKEMRRKILPHNKKSI